MNKALLSVALLLLSVGAWGDDKDQPRVWTSGSDLANQCGHVQDQFATGACVGYVVAAAEIADSGRLKGYHSCIPKGVTKGQLQDVVNKYLARHPEQLEYIGYQVVVVALVEAFPCQEH